MFGGTSLVITAPIATTLFSPTVTPAFITALLPIIALSFIVTPTNFSLGGNGSFVKETDGPTNTLLPILVNGQCMRAIIPGVKQPPKTYKSLEAICKIALSNEQGVTKAINHMVDLATKDKDHNTITFLQFFVNEQIEEEQQFEDILQKFNLIGRDKLAIYEIDKLLGGMATSPASDTQN